MKNPSNWLALEQHYQLIKNDHLKDIFSQDKNRGELYAIEESGLYLDYSKNHFNEQTLELLFKLAKESQLKEKINSLFVGEKVNQSENRPSLHTALRDPNNVNGIPKDTHNTIKVAQDKTFSLVEKVESGEIKNHKEQAFKHLICLGIGGSYLGPKFIINALKSDKKSKLSINFVANIDPNALHQTLSKFNIEDCLFFVASKSFNTLETLNNANLVKQLLLDTGVETKSIHKHFIASTENHQAAIEFGCSQENILPIWDFIGGRFSLWSSIGFPIALALGESSFLELLSGAHKMDRHFIEKDFNENMPVILGCLAIWYQNFFKAPSRAVIPYNHNLKIFPAFLQQLEMESLGKSVDINNKPINYSTGAIIWGSEGSNSQHAFHQLLHQGTHLIPCDLLVCKESNNKQIEANQQHEVLFSQCIAQSRALAFGDLNVKSEKKLQGNSPSNTLVLDRLKPSTLGALIALYEHKTFVQASLLNINAFDQWGVELGKVVGKEVETALKESKALDSSTDSLIEYFKK